MSQKPRSPLVLAVVGATATGKTAFSIDICRKIKGSELVNIDSLQVYQGLDIGTAKPTVDELKGVTHHLFDCLAPPDTFDASHFRKRTLAILADCQKREVPLVVLSGGSGFYLQALEKGLFTQPRPSNEVRESVKLDLKTHGLKFLYEELNRQDFETAERLNPNDSYRISRAIETLRTPGVGKPSEIRKNFQEENLPYRFFKMGLKRRKVVLREQVEKRTQQMIDNGLLEETKKFIAQGLGDWSPLKSIGYVETKEFLEEKISLEEMKVQISHNTMQLAKRQTTWFKRDANIHWFDPDFSLKPAWAYLQELVD